MWKIILDHNDGVVRVQNWLKGKLVLCDDDDEDAADAAVDEVVLSCIGKETTWVPPGTLAGCRGSTNAKNPEEERVCWSKTLFEEETVAMQERKPVSTGPITKDEEEEKQQQLEGQQNEQVVSYPFSFYLPGSLPASMRFEHNDGGCCIEYTLVAHAGEKRLASRHVKVIGPTLTQKAYVHTIKPTAIPVKRVMGLVPCGIFLGAAKVSNTHVGKGQKLHFALSCRNPSSRLPLHRVDARLVETITWWTRNGCGGEATQQKSSVTNILATYQDLLLPGIKTIPCTPQQQQQQQQHDIKSSGVLAAMEQELADPTNYVKIRVPLRARDTYSGELIQVEHTLHITMVAHKNRRRIMESNPCLRIPIQVFDPPIDTGSSRHLSNAAAAVAKTTWPSDDAFKLMSQSHSFTTRSHQGANNNGSSKSFFSITEDQEVSDPVVPPKSRKGFVNDAILV